MSLIPLGKNEQGAERHAVVWNRKDLVEWRQTCPDPNNWHMYETAVESFLLSELRRSTKWIVEPGQKEDQLCVIRMVFKSATAKNDSPAFVSMRNVPTLTRLTDIKEFFPMVIWREVDLQNNKKSYSIELSNKKLKGLDNQAIQNITNNLLNSLKASTAWKLTLGSTNELCRIDMV